MMFNDKFKFIIPVAGIVGGHVLHDTDDTNSRVIKGYVPRRIPIISASAGKRRAMGSRAILLRSAVRRQSVSFPHGANR